MSAKPLALLTTLLLLPSPPGRAEGEPPGEKPEPTSSSIPEVASQEELDALKPLANFEGWELRLALAPGTMPEKPRKVGASPDFSTTPWRILYADFRRTKKGALLPRRGEIRDGEPIGPLDFKLDFDPDGRFDRALKDIIRLEMSDILHEEADRYLFAATVPTAAKGGYRLRVFPPLSKRKPGAAPERKEWLAESIWKQDAPIPIRWIEFAKTANVDLPDLGIPIPDKMSIAFTPFAPDFDDLLPLSIGARPGEKDAPKFDAGTPIPGMIPPKSDPTFRISRSGAGIMIELEEPSGTAIENFLARWWVDDKPVAWTFDEIPAGKLREEAEMKLSDQLREIVFETRIPFRIPFRTPEALKDAHPDSLITLQLLYSPTGTKVLPNPGREVIKEELMHAFALFERNDLRLSNCLEFKLGDVTGR